MHCLFRYVSLKICCCQRLKLDLGLLSSKIVFRHDNNSATIYSPVHKCWPKTSWAGNQGKHKNFDPSLLPKNLWLLFMGFWKKKSEMADSKKLCFSKPWILNIFSEKWAGLVLEDELIWRAYDFWYVQGAKSSLLTFDLGILPLKKFIIRLYDGDTEDGLGLGDYFTYISYFFEQGQRPLSWGNSWARFSKTRPLLRAFVVVQGQMQRSMHWFTRGHCSFFFFF